MKKEKEYLWKFRLMVLLFLFVSLLGITENVEATERFLWPVPNYTNVYQSYSSGHRGTDISQGGIAGKPVVATKSGVVVDAKDTCNCGDPYTPCTCNGRQGNYVIIKHNDGGLSRYLHLQYGSVSVRTGQSINRGDQIGLVGSSGESYGYHLHFDLATGSVWNLNNRYDPMTESYDYNNDSFISYLERPANGGNYTGPIGILGYALHKNGIRNVTAWVNGKAMDCPMYNSPDVAAVYPGYPTGNEGFQAQIPVSYLKEGENEIGIYAYEKDDTPHLIASHKFNWNSFVCKLESPVQNGSYDGTLSIQGYALHKNGLRNVTAWVNGQVMDCPMYERTEIATKYPGYPTGNEGFQAQIPISCLKEGENEIGIYAYEKDDTPHLIASHKFYFSPFVGNLESPTQNGTYDGDVLIKGYALHKNGLRNVTAWVNGITIDCPMYERNDIAFDYPGYPTGKEGFKVNIPSYYLKNGENDISVYAYESDDTPHFITTNKFIYNDKQNPVISDVQITDVTLDSYTVVCTVTDNIGVTSVKFPTWPSADDSGEPIWHTGVINGNIASYVIKKSEHGNKTGTYYTHIYAYDAAGNYSAVAAPSVELGKKHEHEYTSSIKKPATCTEPGIMLYTCKDNDDSYEEEIPAAGHQDTELRNVKEPTCAQEGYTGDTYCNDCNTKLSEGESIAKKSHEWDEGEVKTAATCTTKGIKVYNCINCQTTKAEEVPATGHQHTELRNVEEATCVLEGYSGDTYCIDCGLKVSSGEVTNKKPHTWDNGRVTSEATCTTNGIITYWCWGCRMTRTEEIPATGHQHTELKNAKEATCLLEGYTGDTYCKDCNTLINEGSIIPANNHTWDDGFITTEPTCTEAGSCIYTCIHCQDTRSEVVSATGHQTDIRNVVKATCEQSGFTGDEYCKKCDTLIMKGSVIPATGHTWNDGVVTTEVTCTEDGILTYTCEGCLATRTESISATGHQNTEIRNAVNATCGQQGYTGDTYCIDCNTKLSSGKTIEMKSHVWNDGKIIVAATCTGRGTISYTCTICNAKRSEYIAPKGHRNTEYRNKIKATCVEEGYSGDLYCKACGMKLRDGESIAKKPHSWNNGEITSSATCIENGKETYTCTVCKITRTEEIKATGHQHTELKNTKEATCLQKGYTGDTYCKDCNTLISTGTTIPAASHTWDNGTVTTAPTCTKAGVYTYTCANCQETRTETVSATGHQKTEIRNKKQATCKLEGYTGDTYCTDCGILIKSGSTIKKVAHKWNSGVITKKPTAGIEGVKTYTCQVCKTTKTAKIPALGVKVGLTIKDTKSNGYYKVTSTKGYVTYVKPISAKKTSVVIPDTIIYQGLTCKVTAVSSSAFKGNAYLQTVKIGNNVKEIGTCSFYGCPKLSGVTIGNNVTKIGIYAFGKCTALVKIVIPAKVTTLYKGVFYGCKNLRYITIKTSKLTTSTVGTICFNGIYSKPTILVPKAKYSAYKKLLYARGVSSTALFRVF